MEARAIDGRVSEPRVVQDDAPIPLATESPRAVRVPSTQAIGRRQTRAVARPIVLNRAAEYRFIRADLNRLLVTAGVLLLVMLALLLVVGR